MDFLENKWYPRDSPDILFLGFNQDATCLTVGSVTGFTIYSVKPFKLMYKEDIGAVTLVEMLFSSSMVSIVGSTDGHITSCRLLLVWNTRTRTKLARFYYTSPIYAVKMNPNRLVVGLEQDLRVYDLKSFTHLHLIKYDCNYMVVPHLCCLSPSVDKGYLVIPASSEIGTINIIDIYSLKNLAQVNAHENPIKLLAFNSTGTLLATASTKGTVIRIWSTPNFEKLWTCRRSAIPCTLFHLAFSSSNDYLISSGSSGSIYMFKLDIPDENKTSTQDSNIILDYPFTQFPDHLSSTYSFKEKENGMLNNIENNKIRSPENFETNYVSLTKPLTSRSIKSITTICKSAMNSVSSYLPNSYREAINAFRCVAWVNLGEPCNTMPCIATLYQSNAPNKNQVFVACYTGCAYLYEFSPQGGEARLKDEFFLTRINEKDFLTENN